MTEFAFDEHLMAQPDLVAETLGRAQHVALDPGRPIILTGIRSSFHACQVAAAWLRVLSNGRIRPVVLDANDLTHSEPITSRDQVIVVSHRARNSIITDVLQVANSLGATTVAITADDPESAPEASAVLRTCALERSRTHTASYTTALAVLAKVVISLAGPGAWAFDAALAAVPEAMRQALETELEDDPIDALVSHSQASTLITGSSFDALTAEEAALKIKEGTSRWAEGMHTEYAIHGSPAIFGPSTLAYLIRPAVPDGGRFVSLDRTMRAHEARVVTVGDQIDDDVVVPVVNPLVRPFTVVTPFQRLVSATAHRLNINPDRTTVK